MSEKSYVSPFDLHREEAANLINMPKRGSTGPALSGQEIACVCGGINEEPIPALFHSATRTAYPVRDTTT